jgi:hypothetical protein
MVSIPSSDHVLVDSLDVEGAAAALCCRFGEPTAEACRLATLHDVLNSSRALARELEAFAKMASPHLRGIHCTSDMQNDAQRLFHLLSAWSDAVLAAGHTYREWRNGDSAPDLMSSAETRTTLLLHGTLADGGTMSANAPPV